MPDSPIAQTFPAHILLDAAGRATAAQLTTLAKSKALDPAIFEDERFAPFFWTAEISNNYLDAYSTRMHPSSLKNYAEDAKRGVSFQDSHQIDGLYRTLGQSLTSRYYGPGSQARPEGVAAVEADFYSLLGLDPQIESFVNKARAGITKDVSIGFYGGTYRCSICQRDMRDYSDWSNYCPHYPGQKVAVKDPVSGKATDERVTVEASIEGAHLAEVSSVYDGATPEASVLFVKARELAEAGKLDSKEARFIEDRYRVRLPGSAPAWGVGINLRTGTSGQRWELTGQRATPEEGQVNHEEMLRAILTELDIPEDQDVIGAIRSLKGDQQARIKAATSAREEQVRGALASLGLACEGEDLLAGIRGHAEGLVALRRNAKHGEDWHQRLIGEAAAEGVRAFGEKFTDQRRTALNSLSPEELLERRETWAEIGDARNPGGRSTTDEPLGGGAPRPAPVPLAAYRERA